MNNQNETKNMILSQINAVEGFDPEQYAVDYTDNMTGETYKRLPVMAQMAWFRLRYPMGKIAVRVAGGNDCFVATARVYADCKDAENCFLAEATASRGFLEDKPSISPREWAQTAAVGVALRNAGFGLQFAIAGESFPEVAPNEFSAAGGMAPGMEGAPYGYYGNDEMETVPVMQPAVQPAQIMQQSAMPSQNMQYPQAAVPGMALGMMQGMQQAPVAQPGPALVPGNVPDMQIQPGTAMAQEGTGNEMSDEDRIQKAMDMPCPIKKYAGKTLGELAVADPKALTWIATKFGGEQEVKDAAKLICEYAVGEAAA